MRLSAILHRRGLSMLIKWFGNLHLTLWSQLSISIGSGFWMLMVLLRVLGLISLNGPELLLLLAVFAITPLVLRLMTTIAGKLPFAIDRMAMSIQPFAALFGGVSLLIAPGPVVAITAEVWLAFTGLVALLGVTLLFRRDGIDVGNVCLAMGLIYLPVGGAWFVVARLGIQPLGFSKDTILFTAAHFHYIPLTALILTGLTGQALREDHQRRRLWLIYRVIAAGMIVYPLLVAAGITLTQITGSRIVETVAAILLAINVLLLSALSLRFVVPHTASLLGKALLTISGCTVLLSMSFAGAYALGNATGAWSITTVQMVAMHGWVNALAFGFCGLAGWCIKRTQQERPAEG
jgi:hypothetical protein